MSGPEPQPIAFPWPSEPSSGAAPRGARGRPVRVGHTTPALHVANAANRPDDPGAADHAAGHLNGNRGTLPTAAPAAGPPSGPTPQSLRREILLRLRQNGPASPDQLAGHLGASRTGILQQLRALDAANLVSRQTIRHGVGRPRHVYDVTADAQDLFPSNYDGLAAGLLDAVRALGGEELLDELFAARRRQIGDRIQRRMAERLPANAPVADRVRELAVIQDELGYLATAVADASGTLRLVEHNCAIYHVARGNDAACRAELQLFSDVLGASVVRESHIAAGDRCCSYRVTGPETAR
jgi:predicted ArsR family transcriptional regulator